MESRIYVCLDGCMCLGNENTVAPTIIKSCQGILPNLLTRKSTDKCLPPHISLLTVVVRGHFDPNKVLMSINTTGCLSCFKNNPIPLPRINYFEKGQRKPALLAFEPKGEDVKRLLEIRQNLIALLGKVLRNTCIEILNASDYIPHLVVAEINERVNPMDVINQAGELTVTIEPPYELFTHITDRGKHLTNQRRG